MDDITRYLLSESSRPQLSSTSLQDMGKRASAMYLGSGVPLDQAVTKVASECQGITAEQVFRVVEFANNATFLNLFEKQASDRNVEFEICDPRNVLRALDMEARPIIKEAANHDYAVPAEDIEKTAGWGILTQNKESRRLQKIMDNHKAQTGQTMSGPDAAKAYNQIYGKSKKAEDVLADVKLAQAFGREVKTPSMKGEDLLKEALAHVKIGGREAEAVKADLEQAVSLESIKKASAKDYPEADPFAELVRTHQRVTKLAEDAGLALLKNDSIMKEAEAAFVHEVKQHMLGGGNFGEVTHALSAVGTPGQVKIATKIAVEALEPHGLDPVRARAEMIRYEMEKSASARVVNSSNPIVGTFAAMVKSASAHLQLKKSFEQLEEAKLKIAAMMQRASQVSHAASA